MRVSFPIIFVSDMQRSVSFYRDVLRLPLRFDTPHWTEFGGDDTSLALHASDDPNPERGVQEHLPAGRCRPGFDVPDLDEFHRWMTERNVPCVQKPTELFGARIAQYADPDGLVLSVGESKPRG